MLKTISIARNMTVPPPESVTRVHVAVVLMTYPLIIWLIIYNSPLWTSTSLSILGN